MVGTAFLPFFFLRGGTVLTNIYSMLTRNTYKTRYVNKTKTKIPKKYVNKRKRVTQLGTGSKTVCISLGFKEQLWRRNLISNWLSLPKTLSENYVQPKPLNETI